MKNSRHSPPRLVVIEGNEKGKIYFLKQGGLVIGRSNTDIVINDPRISREHLKLEFDSETGKLTFSDLKSLNGCQVNGETQVQGELKDGDKIQIGNTVLDCQMSTGLELTDETRKEPVLKTAEVVVDTAVVADPIGDAPPVEESKPVAQKLPPKQRTKRPLAIALSVLLLVILLTRKETKESSNPLASSPSSSASGFSLVPVQQALEAGETQKALELANNLLVKNPNHPEIEEVLGDIYLKTKKLEPAIKQFKLSLEHKNPSKLIQFKLARAYIQAGLISLAVEQLNTIDKLIQDSPSEKDLFIEFAGLLLEYPELNHSFERALIISKALQTDIAPQSTIGYRLEAETLIQQKKIKEAEVLYQRALAIAPQDQEILEQLTMTRLSLHDFQGAKEVTEQWLKQSPNEVRALLAVSYLNFYERDYIACIPKLQSVIALLSQKPENLRRLEAIHLLGMVYWEQGQRTEAERYLTESCRLGFERSCKHQALLTKETTPPAPDPP